MYSVGAKIICININNNCNNLITIGKIYKILKYTGEQYERTAFIMTDVGVRCHIPINFFLSLSENRKSKLEKLNKICSK